MILATLEHQLQQYEHGKITALELVRYLIHAAAHKSPEAIAPLVPPDILQEIQGFTVIPPASEGETPRLYGIESWAYSADQKGIARRQQREREQQLLWYNGAWKWHRFFKQV